MLITGCFRSDFIRFGNGAFDNSIDKEIPLILPEGEVGTGIVRGVRIKDLGATVEFTIEVPPGVSDYGLDLSHLTGEKIEPPEPLRENVFSKLAEESKKSWLDDFKG